MIDHHMILYAAWQVLTAFVEAVREGYTQGGRVANPFHCFRHGFDVFQVVSALVSGDTLQVRRRSYIIVTTTIFVTEMIAVIIIVASN